MTSDPDDALRWEGDDDATSRDQALPRGWKAVGKGSREAHSGAEADAAADAHEHAPLSTAMLVAVGVIGGIYLLYSVGWVIGGFRLQASALFLIPDVMYHVSLWAAALAPALWFACAWVLTRRSPSWARLAALLAGVLLLVPWPFITSGAEGAA